MAGSSLGDTKGSSPFAMVGAGQVVEDALLGPIKKINRSNSMIYKTQLICTRFDALKKFILYKKKRERERNPLSAEQPNFSILLEMIQALDLTEFIVPQTTTATFEHIQILSNDINTGRA